MRSLLLILVMQAGAVHGQAPVDPDSLRRRIIKEAVDILENSEISYIYGGSRQGTPDECERCNQCLAMAGKAREGKGKALQACPGCNRCSLDCSHFTSLVYRRSGLSAPYLTTEYMRRLAPATLLHRYHLMVVGQDPRLALPGDLLVYRGHVVLLEKLRKEGRGDLIHATSGKDLRGPGMGIQRERYADLGRFRGPLQRVLRHGMLVVKRPGEKRRFRPVP